MDRAGLSLVEPSGPFVSGFTLPSPTDPVSNHLDTVVVVSCPTALGEALLPPVLPMSNLGLREIHPPVSTWPVLDPNLTLRPQSPPHPSYQVAAGVSRHFVTPSK